VTSHGCHAGYIIKCSRIYTDPEGQTITAGFEYVVRPGKQILKSGDEFNLAAGLPGKGDVSPSPSKNRFRPTTRPGIWPTKRWTPSGMSEIDTWFQKG